jgi:hypothetical protein
MRLRPLSLLALAFSLLASAPLDAAAEELVLDWGGRIQADLRFRTEAKRVGDYYDRIELPAGVERAQSTFGVRLDATYGRFSGVAAVDLVLEGLTPSLPSLEDLSRVEEVDPYRIEVPALYVEGKDVLLDGLDLRIGQQLVLWGEGDQFNPTNNLNPDDLRDPLLFGRQQANFMVKLDYWVTESLSLTGVLVPIFRPALLPRTAALGARSIDRLPFTDDALRHRLEAERAAVGGSLLGHPTVVSSIKPVMPEPTFENMQAAFRIATTVAEQDVALSYYVGRTDFPQPFRNHTTHAPGVQCAPNAPDQCIQGLLETEVSVHYPRMHVYGFNMAGEANPLGFLSDSINAIGYRLEAALIVPERSTMKITQGDLALAFPQPAGEYDYDNDGSPGGKEPEVVSDTPFLKWVVGLDYSFGEHVYVNAQWVHGLLDEYGAGDFIEEGWAVRSSGVTSSDGDTLFQCAVPRDGSRCARELLRPRLADYVVVGVDFKFLADQLLLRLFGILDVSGIEEERWDESAQRRIRTHHSPFSPDGFSAVIYPELEYDFGNGLELGGGALIQLGRDYTKFGDPAAGGSTVFTRGRFSF